jgi:hypothetical protein
MIKYLFSYYIEKLHRYCFDNLYVQDHKITFIEWLYLRLLDFCNYIIPDFREYLNKCDLESHKKYSRYKNYER